MGRPEASYPRGAGFSGPGGRISRPASLGVSRFGFLKDTIRILLDFSGRDSVDDRELG